MLTMRLARPADKSAVARVIDVRCDWLEARELPSWRDAKDHLVSQCDNPEQDVWVLEDETAGVIGQTVVQDQGPPFGWTEAEQAEQALYLSGSVTDPAAKSLRPGSLMAWWAVDLAARQGVPWVRRHTQVAEVAAYDRTQGFPCCARSSARTPGCTCWRGRPSAWTCRPGSVRGSGQERPCRLVQRDHLHELAPRVFTEDSASWSAA